MSLHRRLLPAVTRLLVAVLAVVSLGPLVHIEPGHDSDCDPVVVVHDHTKHAFTGAEAPDAPLHENHCTACHWGRSFRGPISWASIATPSLDQRVRYLELGEQVPSSPAALLVPARAPPAPLA